MTDLSSFDRDCVALKAQTVYCLVLHKWSLLEPSLKGLNVSADPKTQPESHSQSDSDCLQFDVKHFVPTWSEE